jgi:hypothetical protein
MITLLVTLSYVISLLHDYITRIIIRDVISLLETVTGVTRDLDEDLPRLGDVGH